MAKDILFGSKTCSAGVSRKLKFPFDGDYGGLEGQLLYSGLSWGGRRISRANRNLKIL